MHRFCLCTLLVLFTFFSGGSVADIVFSYVNYEKFFAGTKGAFVIHDVQKNLTVRNSEQESTKQYPPCGTFDILIGLAGLQAGVLKDQNSTLSAPNVTLLSTMQKPSTAGTFFQEVAAKVGPEKMQKAVNSAAYGNRTVSGTSADGLLISTDEQVVFLSNFYSGKLGFDPRAQEVVRSVLVKKTNSSGTLSGRSSLCRSGNSNVAWFVGHLKSKKGEYVFSTSMVGGSELTPDKVESVTRSILGEMRLL